MFYKEVLKVSMKQETKKDIFQPSFIQLLIEKYFSFKTCNHFIGQELTCQANFYEVLAIYKYNISKISGDILFMD